MEDEDMIDALGLVKSLIDKFENHSFSDERNETLNLLQDLKNYLMPNTTQTEAPSLNEIEERGKKVFMENNLDLNENEVDYYEEMVNDLASRLEESALEKDALQEQCDSLREEIKVSRESTSNLESKLKESEKLKTELTRFVETCKESFSAHHSNISSGPLPHWVNLESSSHLEFIKELISSFSSGDVTIISKASLSCPDQFSLSDVKQDQVKAQAKQLHLLQDLNHELKVKLEVLQRDNGLLQQEIQILKRMTETKQLGGQDSLLSWMSDELKVLDLTANLKEVTKQNRKLETEMENLETTLTLKTRTILDLQKENDLLKDNFRKLQSEYDSVKLILVKHESSSKLKQLDQDEEVELLRQHLATKEEELSELFSSIRMKNIELAESSETVENLKALITKLVEKEVTNDDLISELRKSFPENDSIQNILNSLFKEVQNQMSEMMNFEIQMLTCLNGQVNRVNLCADAVKRIRESKEKGGRPDVLRESRVKIAQLEKKIFEGEESSTLKSLLVASEKRLELISADYAKNYAQNSKVFAFLENECCRLKGLCDHLRSVNSKINGELKKAMFIENKSKSLEQKLRILQQSESIWSEKCRKLEFTLKSKNEELLHLLRGHEEAENSRISSLEKDVDLWKNRYDSIHREFNALSLKNEQVELQMQETSLTFENEKKLLELKIESAKNELLMLTRSISEKEIEMSSIKSRLEEQTLKLMEADMKQGLLSQEILVHDESSLRKITELSSELEERVIKVEHLNLELQKTKAQLYDVESKLLSSDEEISRVLLKLAEKEEAISQLETMVETQKKQISDSTSQMQKVQADWLAGQSEIKKISMALNSVNETFQIELRGKVEVENNLRLSLEKSDVLEEKLISYTQNIKEMKDAIEIKDKKILNLLDKTSELEERVEYLQAANEALSTSKLDYAQEFEAVAEVNRGLEISLTQLKDKISGLEDILFEEKANKTRLEENLNYTEERVKVLISKESLLAERLQKLANLLIQIPSADCADVTSARKTVQNWDLVDLDTCNLSVPISAELSSLEEAVKVSLLQFSALVEKLMSEVQMKEQSLKSEDQLKIKFEDLRIEHNKLVNAKDSISAELRFLQKSLSDQKELGDRVKLSASDLTTKVQQMLTSKFEQVRLILTPEIPFLSDSLEWNLPLDISFDTAFVTAFSGKVNALTDFILDGCKSLVERCHHLQRDLSQTQRIFHEQLQVLQNEKDALFRSNESLRNDLNQSQSNVLEWKRKSDDFLRENEDMRVKVEEFATNYSELEKEFKVVANTNIELAQSLAEAEDLCLELRNNFKIAESQLEESRSSLAQAQYQTNLFQKRCTEGETRFETLSFSFKRLKAEKEALESVKLNLELDLDRLSSQALLLTNNGNADEYNSFIFEIEKIASVLDSIMSFAQLGELAVDNSLSKPEEIMLKLETLRSWIKMSSKERNGVEMEKVRFEEQVTVVTNELNLKRQELDLLVKANNSLKSEIERVQSELDAKSTSLESKILEYEQIKQLLEHNTSVVEEFSTHRVTLESENRKMESELRLMRNELNLREDAIKRLKQDLDSSKIREEEIQEEVRQRMAQLDTAKSSCEAMTSTIQQLEQQIQELKASRTSISQQLQKQMMGEASVLVLEQQIDRLQLELESYKKENVLIKSDKLTVDEVNQTLRKELEITKSKAVTLEQHVALVQQEKSGFIDEINETRLKIQLAKESFEFEKAQRIKSEAAAAALKQAQLEGRLKLTEIHQSSLSAEALRDENDRKQMKSAIQELKLELDQKVTQLSRERSEKEELKSLVERLKTQLTERVLELKQASAFATTVRTESKVARQLTFDIATILRELIILNQIDTTQTLEVGDQSFLEERVQTDAEEKSSRLFDSLGLEEIHRLVDILKRRCFLARERIQTMQQSVDSLSLQNFELSTLKSRIEELEGERERLNVSFSKEIQILQTQLNNFRSADVEQSNLIQKINSLEVSLKQEREQKESFLSELMEMIAKSNQATSSEEVNNEVMMHNSEVSSLRIQISTLKAQCEDMRRECEAVNHHRTVLKAVVEDLEVQLQSFNEKPKVTNGDSRFSTEEDIAWEINRLKRKLSTMSELCRIYHTGLVTLSQPRFFDSAAPMLDYIQRDTLIKSLYEEDIRLLDLRIDELQLKLRQYRKYGLEVKKQFEEMLKSIHRIGKQPAMDIAIRQIEHLRCQLEESQDYIASLQDESAHDRKFYRSRLHGFVAKVSLFEKFLQYSAMFVEKMNTIKSNSRMNTDFLEIWKELVSLHDQFSRWGQASFSEASDDAFQTSDFGSVVVKSSGGLRVEHSTFPHSSHSKDSSSSIPGRGTLRVTRSYAK